MSEDFLNILSEKVEKIEENVNFLLRYTTQEALASAYRSFALRNMILERKLKERLGRTSKKLRIYYYAYLIDQVNFPLLEALCADEDFEIRVLLCQPDKNIRIIPEQYLFFKQQGYNVNVSKFHLTDGLEIEDSAFDCFDPDICFSEMPYGVLPCLEKAITPDMVGGWLPKFSDIFSSPTLEKALFCHVHYAYFLAEEWSWILSLPDLNAHHSLPYQNFSWLYFLESELHLQYAKEKNSFGNTANYVVTGYPKYDMYLTEPIKPSTFSWKFSLGEKKRLVYAPHFARSNSTLATTCETLLKLADSGDYEIVFKPHPVYSSIATSFAQKFSEHPACQTIRNSNSAQYIFSTADLAIISSVSMHADGLFSGKPYISELTESNFNHIGQQVRSTAYTLDVDTDLHQLIDKILVAGDDPKKAERDRVRAMLAIPGKTATGQIIQTIKDRLELS